MRFKLDREKLKDAVRVIVDSCNPHDLGAVKLHKVLYYADMISYLESGSPITGAIYRKRPFGPTCDSLLGVLSELEGDGSIRIDEVAHYGYLKKEFRSLKRRNHSVLGESELKIIESMINFVCHENTARSISNFSHDVVWDMVDFGQEIPYHASLNWMPTEVSQSTLDEATEVWSRIANTRPIRSSELESRVPTAFRARLLEHARQKPLS